jgi:hypothetical protein
LDRSDSIWRKQNFGTLLLASWKEIHFHQGFFKWKIYAAGTVSRYKARLVSKSFGQRGGIDFVETSAPFTEFQSIRCLIAITTYYGLKLEQINVVTAFLNP